MDKKTLEAIANSRMTVAQAAKAFRRVWKGMLTAKQAAKNFYLEVKKEK